MGLFPKQQKGEEPLYQTNYMGFYIRIYSNRVEFKSSALLAMQSVPLNQIASLQLGMIGTWQIILETTGGKKYMIPTTKKKEVQQAIYAAQAHLAGFGSPGQISAADEIAKLHTLKEQGVISDADFETKKKQLLGL